MFDEYLNPPPCVDLQVPIVNTPKPAVSTGTPSSTIIDEDAPSISTSQTTPETPSPVIPLGVEEVDHDIEVAHMDNNPFVEFLIPEPSSEESSTQIEAMQEELNEFEHLEVWIGVDVVVALVVLWRRWGGGGGVDVVMIEMKVVVVRGVGWGGRGFGRRLPETHRKR
ncbi:hypothetical protein Tco_1185204 [Tanacetum coccineum]